MKYVLLNNADMSSEIDVAYKFDGTADISIAWSDVEGEIKDGVIKVFGTENEQLLGWTLLAIYNVTTEDNTDDYELLHNEVSFEVYRIHYIPNNVEGGGLTVILNRD